MTGSALEQELRTKGPRVWLDMDQKELDDAYDQSVWAPNQSHVSARRVLLSESIRARLKPERIAYGPTEIEQLDIYKTTRGNAPIQSLSTAAHGAAALPRTPPIRPKCLWRPARSLSRSISYRLNKPTGTS